MSGAPRLGPTRSGLLQDDTCNSQVALSNMCDSPPWRLIKHCWIELRRLNSAKSYILITYSLLTYYIHISYIQTLFQVRSGTCHHTLSYYSLTYSSINTVKASSMDLEAVADGSDRSSSLASLVWRKIFWMCAASPSDRLLTQVGWMNEMLLQSSCTRRAGDRSLAATWRPPLFNCSIIQVSKWQISRQGRVWREEDVCVTF